MWPTLPLYGVGGGGSPCLLVPVLSLARRSGCSVKEIPAQAPVIVSLEARAPKTSITLRGTMFGHVLYDSDAKKVVEALVGDLGTLSRMACPIDY